VFFPLPKTWPEKKIVATRILNEKFRQLIFSFRVVTCLIEFNLKYTCFNMLFVHMQYTFINDYKSYVYIALQGVNCLQVLCLQDFYGSLLFV